MDEEDGSLTGLEPIVFTGHDCANIPFDYFACDHLEEHVTR